MVLSTDERQYVNLILVVVMQIVLKGLIPLSTLIEDIQEWNKNGSKPADRPIVTVPVLPTRVQSRLDDQGDFIGGSVPEFVTLNSGSGCMVYMPLIDNDEIIKFSMKPDFKTLANTLDRNALALEMRCGIEFPRDEKGNYLVFSKNTEEQYKQYFGVALHYTGGLRGSLKSYEGNTGFFEESNDLEVLWSIENAPSVEDFVLGL